MKILFDKKELFLLEEIVKRNFSSKYKDSLLGIMWSVLKPLLVMVLLTIVFSTIFKGAVENYPVYLLAGRCIYDFFTAAIGVSMVAIKSNKNILQKTSAPKNIFVIGGVISEFLNFIITVIILIAVMIVTKNPFHLDLMIFSVIPIAALILMILGLSFLLSILYVYYTDVFHLWGVMTMMLMYASAIFYPMSIVPEPFHEILSYNPVYWIIEQFRFLFAYGTIPNTLNMINTLLISGIIFIFGLIIFKKYERKTTIKL